MDISKLSNEQKLRNWKQAHKLLDEGKREGDWAKVNCAKKYITQLQPFYNEFSTPKATQAQPTKAATGSKQVEHQAAPRFNFYMTAVPTSQLDQLCHAIFANWLTFRGFKRQSSAERLADYRQIITCIMCNLAYSGVVRVSRDKADYARAESHYRPTVFNKRFLSLLDQLHEMGVIVQTKGERYKRNYAADFGPSKAKYMSQDSILTRLSAGHTIVDQLRSVTRAEVIIETSTQEVVMLKRDAGSDLVEYDETPRTMKYRRQMKLVNEHLEKAGSLLAVEGEAKFDNRARFLVRKFTYSNFEKGGRLWGGLWDSPMKKSERETLLRIQGERTVEIDFNSAIIHIAYALHGEEPPRQTDMYSIPGLHPESRPGVKKFISAHLFRESNRKQFPKDQTTSKSIIEDFHSSDRSKSYTQVLALIEKVHPALVRDFFGTGVGHHLQFLESQLLVNILLRCREKGLVCLPLHDCLIVREDKGERVASIMEGTSTMVLGRRIPVTMKGLEEREKAA